MLQARHQTIAYVQSSGKFMGTIKTSKLDQASQCGRCDSWNLLRNIIHLLIQWALPRIVKVMNRGEVKRIITFSALGDGNSRKLVLFPYTISINWSLKLILKIVSLEKASQLTVRQQFIQDYWLIVRLKFTKSAISGTSNINFTDPSNKSK